MKFSAIIPAYNEAPRIQKVLKIATESHHLDEVIVIDDGSTDNTKRVIEDFQHPKLRKIFLEKNAGKAKAVMEWVRQAKSDYIVMIDSDLIGLESSHIDALIEPIMEGKADTTLSVRKDSLLVCRAVGSDFLSGDRVIPKYIFSPEWYFTEGKGYGLEVKLNKKILEQELRIANVDFPDVLAPSKRFKYGLLEWFKRDLKMSKEILHTVSLGEFLGQFWKFSRFSKNACTIKK